MRVANFYISEGGMGGKGGHHSLMMRGYTYLRFLKLSVGHRFQRQAMLAETFCRPNCIGFKVCRFRSAKQAWNPNSRFKISYFQTLWVFHSCPLICFLINTKIAFKTLQLPTLVPEPLPEPPPEPSPPPAPKHHSHPHLPHQQPNPTT